MSAPKAGALITLLRAGREAGKADSKGTLPNPYTDESIAGRINAMIDANLGDGFEVVHPVAGGQVWFFLNNGQLQRGKWSLPSLEKHIFYAQYAEAFGADKRAAVAALRRDVRATVNRIWSETLPRDVTTTDF